MLDKTYREIITTLFKPSDDAAAVDPRTEVLVAIVFDLLVEVEALRSALLASDAGTSSSALIYKRAYRDIAYLTHDAAGPRSGPEKLLARFYPEPSGQERKGEREARVWRECLFLSRIGFTEDEITAYKEEAQEAEAFT